MITDNIFYGLFSIFAYSCQKMSLDALGKRILGVTLKKSQKIGCSNREQEKLSPQQIEYAANDALVAIHMFLMLAKEKVKQSSDVNDFSLREKKISFRNEDLGDGFGLTVNLCEFESGEREEYLATSEVMNLFSLPSFAQTAGYLCQGLIDIPPIINPILIRVYPRKWGWPDLPQQQLREK